MNKDDIVQYNVRLNLSNPYDLKLHQAIMNANMSIYKSKNNYLKKVAYRGVFGDEDNLSAESDVVDFKQLATKKDLEEVEHRVRCSLIQELFRYSYQQASGIVQPQAVDRFTEPEIPAEPEIDDAVLDAAKGYF